MDTQGKGKRMNNDFIVEDNGDRQVFDSGMVRDTTEGKVNFDLLWVNGIPYDQQPMTRFAEHMTKGASKYGERNFEKANGWDEFNRFIASTGRHFNLWRCGEKKEDHLAAVMFNVLALMMMEARGFTILTPPTPPSSPSERLTIDFRQFNDKFDKLVEDMNKSFNDNVGGSEDAMPDTVNQPKEKQ
jgi:hypothetical protein